MKIENNPEVDGFISLDAMTHFLFAGFFAIRMEHYWIDFERVIVDYIRSLDQDKSAHIKYVDELHVQALVDNVLLSHW